MVRYIFFLLIVLSNNNLYSQNPKSNSFKMVKIPDDLRVKLALVELNKEKLETATDSAYTAIYVFDIIDKKNFTLKKGIYSWKVMGPHFVNRLFINYNNQTFIFKSKGSIDSIGVLQEFIDCIKLLHITKEDRIKYLKAISRYLQEELNG